MPVWQQKKNQQEAQRSRPVAAIAGANGARRKRGRPCQHTLDFDSRAW